MAAASGVAGKMSVVDTFHDFLRQPQNLDLSNIGKTKEKWMTVLRNLTESLKNATNRDNLPEFVFDDMMALLARLSHVLANRIRDEGLKTSSQTLGMVDLATEGFRALRNSCAGCKRNQEEVLRSGGLFWITTTILNTLITSPKNFPSNSQEVVQCLRSGVQFLGNAVAGFEDSKTMVWESIFTTFKPLLQSPDTTLANYTCMLLYTCIKPKHVDDLLASRDGVDIVVAVLTHFSKHDTEWGLYILEKVLEHPRFLNKSFTMLKPNEKLLLMEFMASKLHTMGDRAGQNSHSSSHEGLNEVKVAVDNLTYLCEEFKSKADSILGIGTKRMTEGDSILTTKMLEALCSATGTPQHGRQIQKDSALLEAACRLLHSMHMLGKEGGNAFSSVSKLASTDKADHNHPLFGVKKDLVRLIGNMCYRHPANQNKVRELGAIPIILEHANIDDKNPFIQQWTILAIRNLCEGNSENQSLLQNMRMEGISDQQALMQQIGLDVTMDGEKIKVKSSKKDNKSSRR